MRHMSNLTAVITGKPMGRKLVCKQCGHKWHARVEGRDPLICPARCQYEWYWNVDPKLLTEKQKKNKRREGKS